MPRILRNKKQLPNPISTRQTTPLSSNTNPSTHDLASNLPESPPASEDLAVDELQPPSPSEPQEAPMEYYDPCDPTGTFNLPFSPSHLAVTKSPNFPTSIHTDQPTDAQVPGTGSLWAIRDAAKSLEEIPSSPVQESFSTVDDEAPCLPDPSRSQASNIQMELLSLLSDQSTYLDNAKVTVVFRKAPPSKSNNQPSAQKHRQRQSPTPEPQDQQKGTRPSSSKARLPASLPTTHYEKAKVQPKASSPTHHRPTQVIAHEKRPSKQIGSQPGKPHAKNREERSEEDALANSYTLALKPLLAALLIFKTCYTESGGNAMRISDKPLSVSTKLFKFIVTCLKASRGGRKNRFNRS